MKLFRGSLEPCRNKIIGKYKNWESHLDPRRTGMDDRKELQ